MTTETDHLLKSPRNAARLRKGAGLLRSSITGRFVRDVWWRNLPLIRFLYVRES